MTDHSATTGFSVNQENTICGSRRAFSPNICGWQFPVHRQVNNSLPTRCCFVASGLVQQEIRWIGCWPLLCSRVLAISCGINTPLPQWSTYNDFQETTNLPLLSAMGASDQVYKTQTPPGIPDTAMGVKAKLTPDRTIPKTKTAADNTDTPISASNNKNKPPPKKSKWACSCTLCNCTIQNGLPGFCLKCQVTCEEKNSTF